MWEGEQAGAFRPGAQHLVGPRRTLVERRAQRPSGLYCPTPCILLSLCQDFRVGLQGPSLEAPEAKGSNVPSNQ